jgi:predicted nucleic-acid-binding Zn-ribbon protein
MSGTGISKMPERFIFVSCESCGFTEIYNVKMLCKQDGVGTDLLDLFFG